jgi:hypothetical protein
MVLYRPYRAENISDSLTQGDALGYGMAPFQGLYVIVMSLNPGRCPGLLYDAPSGLKKIISSSQGSLKRDTWGRDPPYKKIEISII